MKRIFKKIMIVGIMLGVVGLNMTCPVMAQPEAEQAGGERRILGLVPWDYGVNLEAINSEDELQKEIVKIAFNILQDVTVVAGYLVLGFVIWGGYLYIMSEGDPGKVQKGKKTLTSAFIGLAIVGLSNVIFAAIRTVLGASSKAGGLPNADLNQIVENSISWALGMAAVVAVIFIVYGGILYMTSAGDSGKIMQAKNMIMYALIGLAIVGLAELITAFVGGAINSATKGSGVIVQQIKLGEGGPWR